MMRYLKNNIINKRKISLRKIDSINDKIMKVNINKYTKNKKSRIDYIDSSWIPASKIRNAALNDHFIDYCRVYNVKDINDIPEKRIFNFDPSSKKERIDKKPHEANNFIDFLLTSGNFFENNIIKKLKNKYPDNFIEICDSLESRNVKNYEKTLHFMKKGIPIIHQAVLYNYEHKVFGAADLIVRSDWINKLVNVKVLNEDEIKLKAPKLNGYHYRVIDIKFHKLHLNSDNKTLRNNGSVKPFKNQLTIYNLALGEMQGYTPNECYILGNGWIYNKTVNKKLITRKSNNPFSKLGVIDFDNKDKKYKIESLEHVNWLRELDRSTDWTHDPPSNNKLYPNMCNKYDGIYHKVKKQVADKYNEITSIWNCSYVNRKKGFKNNIKSWDNPRCNSKNLGIKGKKLGPFIDEILKFQRQNNKIINIKKIKNNNLDWRNDKKVTIYLDFETIGDLLLKSHNKTNVGINGDFVFMIGIGWQYPLQNKWNYKCLLANEINAKEEKNLLLEMNKILDDFDSKYGISNVIHWSHAEPKIHNQICKRHNIYKRIKWFDLLNFFKSNKIFVKGALNFSLKTIATQMSNYKMINTNWDNLDCSSGINAMFDSWKEYVNNEDINKSDIMKEVIKYNEVDCKTLYEILSYFRKYY